MGRGSWSLCARQWHQEMKLERDSRASTGAQRLSLSGPGQIWAVTQRRGIVVFWLNCCACCVNRRLGRSLFFMRSPGVGPTAEQRQGSVRSVWSNHFLLETTQMQGHSYHPRFDLEVAGHREVKLCVPAKGHCQPVLRFTGSLLQRRSFARAFGFELRKSFTAMASLQPRTLPSVRYTLFTAKKTGEENQMICQRSAVWWPSSDSALCLPSPRPVLVSGHCGQPHAQHVLWCTGRPLQPPQPPPVKEGAFGTEGESPREMNVLLASISHCWAMASALWTG